MSLLDLLTLCILAVVGVQLGQAARQAFESRRRLFVIVRGLRRRHVARAVPVVVLVLGALVVLLQIPGLSFGWWTALGGVGNPVFGASERGPSGELALWVSLGFALLLLVSLPLLVEREERIFRKGAEQRGVVRNAVVSLLFGLLHTVIGIPIAAGLALAIGGAYFTQAYLREYRATRSVDAALLESTRAHLGYNLTIVLAVVVALTVEVSM